MRKQRIERTRGHKMRNSKVFKANGRDHLKKKKALMNQSLMIIPDGYKMEKDVCGCVGEIRPGTIIRLNTTRRNAYGQLFFFDAFALDPEKNLRWIGEFDVLSVDDLALSLGEEVTDFNEVFVPDEEGILKEVSGSMIEEGAVDNVPEPKSRKPKRASNSR